MTVSTALEDRLEAAEREGAALREQVAAQRRHNEELAAHLEELRGGRRPRWSRLRRFIAWFSVLLCAGGLIAASLFRDGGQQRRAVRVVKDSMSPSLLVTSTPDNAQARVDGELVGLTPVLVTLAPVARRYPILLEAPGFKPLEGEVSVTATAGAHFDGHLVPKSAAKDR
jgi:hypothetical protein